MSGRAGKTTAVVLAAHGSRRSRSARRLVEGHAAALARRGLADRVVAAFHHGRPGFGEVLDRLTADRVLVIPFFTSGGHFTERVLPAALRQNQPPPAGGLRITPPLGAEPGITRILARRAGAFAARHGWELGRSGLLLAGHGSGRHPASRRTTQDHARQLETTGLAAEVRAGFLDDLPSVEAALAGFHSDTVIVLPFLIGGADHAGRDLPRRLGLPPRPWGPGRAGKRLVGLDAPLGADDELTDVLAGMVARELPRLRAGWVALVGAGPGDPGLITVRGVELLREADVVLHDRLAAPELLALTRPEALLLDVGKRPGSVPVSQEQIGRLLAEHARQGRRVVRLKGGDPFVFGRGAEELDACRAAGVECRVVPGVSSAIAVPAAAGIPVTERGRADAFAVITGVTESGAPALALPELAAALAAVDTLVLLMGRRVLGELAGALVAAGRHPDTPVACIQEGTTARQRVVGGTLATIAARADAAGLGSPG